MMLSLTESSKLVEDALQGFPEFQKKEVCPVGWYGLDRSLLQLLDLPLSFPLLVHTTHGPLFSDKNVEQYILRSSWPVFVDRAAYRKILVERHGKEAYVSGSPHVHFRTLNGIRQREDACGTLVFPSHSQGAGIADLDWDAYARSLRALPARYQPVTACVYWEDLLLGRHRSFLDCGIPVVTCGHRCDPAFVSKLYTYLSKARFVSGNRLGTHTLLALEMGIPYFPFGPEATYRLPDGGLQPVEMEDYEEKQEFKALLPHVDEDPPTISRELAERTARILGIADHVDRNVLRKVVVRQLVNASPQAASLVYVLKTYPEVMDFFHVGVNRVKQPD